MICGNCKCFTSFGYWSDNGICRKYNKHTQLRTQCLKEEVVVCNCMISECMDRGEKEFKIGDNEDEREI